MQCTKNHLKFVIYSHLMKYTKILFMQNIKPPDEPMIVCYVNLEANES